jgi:hypothetical protein
MRIVIANGVLGIGLLLPPIAAELYTAEPGRVPGTGFDVLLYQPVQYAYALVGLALFVALNVFLSTRSGRSPWSGLPIGAGAALCWFFLAFLAVGQLHLSLGGKL